MAYRLPPPPCARCPRGPSVNCSRSYYVGPNYGGCRSWTRWFQENWPRVTRALAARAGKEPKEMTRDQAILFAQAAERLAEEAEVKDFYRLALAALLRSGDKPLTCEGCACRDCSRDKYPCNTCSRNDETIMDQFRLPEGET